MSGFHSTRRRLLKRPISSIVAILTLALGIGAATAVFALVDELLWHPLPFPRADRLIEIHHRSPNRPTGYFGTSIPRYHHYRASQTMFSDIAVTLSDAMALTGAGDPIQLFGQRITSNTFSVLGVKPLLGRVFSSEEDKPANHTVVISEHCWRERLGQDPEVIGRVLTLNGVGHTVIGVVPSFPPSWGSTIEVWTTWPFSVRGISEEQLARGAQYLNVIARLKPGLTLQQAQSGMEALSNSYNTRYPSNSDAKRMVVLISALDDVTRDIKPSLLVVASTALCLLLIGCSNVGNLLLARFASRQREVVVRTALGASSRDIIKLFLAESIFFSLLSCILGLFLAGIFLRILPAISGNLLHLEPNFNLSWSAVVFALLLALVSGIAIGLFPAWQASRSKVTNTLNEGGRSSTPNPASRRFRSVLLAAQVAIALSLISSAGVLLKTFIRLQRQDLGFESEQIYTAAVDLPVSRYGDTAARSRFAERLLAELQSSSQVEAAAVVLGPPYSGNRSGDIIARSDASPLPLAERSSAYDRSCTPHYFKTLGIPFLQGRDFSPRDTPTSPPVVIINQAVADRFFSGEDPVGRFLLIGAAQGKGTLTEIVGIVGNVRSVALKRAPEPEIYRPWAQHNIAYTQFVLRGKDRVKSIASELRGALQRIDPLLPLMRENTLNKLIDQSLGENRLLTSVVSTFGSLAAILAALGIYSIASYNVIQRTEEIGVRMALGAESRDVVLLILWQTLGPAVIGVGFGLILTFWSKRLLTSQLFEVSALDPAVIAGSVFFIVMAATAASIGPALRAARVDPLQALRNE